MNPAPSPPLAIPPDVRPALRLFCIPFAGGGASAYFRWGQGLPAEIQVCPIQLRGHETRFAEDAFRSMGPMIEELGPALLPWLDVPFAIFGHSMGAIIGFELARFLRRAAGKAPLCLFVSSRRAPQVATSARKIAGLPDNEFVREMTEQYNAIPDLVRQDRELMNRFIPILKADMTMLESYEYRRDDPFSFMISAFGGLEDRHVSMDDLDAWREHTRGPSKVRQFPGGHFLIKDRRAEVLRAVAQDLIEVLSRGRVP